MINTRSKSCGPIGVRMSRRRDQKLQYYMTASIFGQEEVVARSGRKMRVVAPLSFKLIHITVDNNLNQ